MKLTGYSSAKKGRRFKTQIQPKIEIEYKCCYCETALNKGNISKEHFWPKRLGGKGKSFNHENIHPCCNICNQEKGGDTPLDYIKYLYSQIGKVDGILLATKINNVQNICGVVYEKIR